MQNIEAGTQRFPLDRQTILAGMVLPLICWLVFCWAFWPGNSRLQVPPWGIIVPLGLFIALGAAVLKSSAHLPLDDRGAQMLIGAMWAGALCALTVGAFTGLLSGMGLFNISKEILGFTERPPANWREGIYYQTNYTALYASTVSVFILGLTPLWTAYAISRRAFRLTMALRERNEVRAAIPAMIGGFALLFATAALLIIAIPLLK